MSTIPYLTRPSAIWRAAAAVAALVTVLASASAHAQSIICCNQNINVGGNWTGSSHAADCQKYFDSAPPAILVQMCTQRAALACIKTDRCKEIPPEELAPKSSPDGGAASLPSNPDRDGLVGGFGGPPPTPPTGRLSPPRLVYLITGAPSGGKPVAAFTVFLDRAACLLPLAADNRPSEPMAARHVVRGRIVRGDGRVRIEAEANELALEAKLGPFTGEAAGEDAAAVAKAMRAVTEKMKLVCAR